MHREGLSGLYIPNRWGMFPPNVHFPGLIPNGSSICRGQQRVFFFSFVMEELMCACMFGKDPFDYVLSRDVSRGFFFNLR